MKLFSKTFVTLGILPIIFAAGAASAGTMTIGQSYGAECYDNAKGRGIGVGDINACNRAIDEGSLTRKDRASTFVNRGIVRAFRDDLTGALSDYEKALRLKPELAEAFANRGNVYIRMERYDDALAELNTALTLDLKSPERVYYNRAIIYEKLGQTRAAYEDLMMAVKLAPQWGQPKRELQRYQVVSR